MKGIFFDFIPYKIKPKFSFYFLTFLPGMCDEKVNSKVNEKSNDKCKYMMM